MGYSGGDYFNQAGEFSISRGVFRFGHLNNPHYHHRRNHRQAPNVNPIAEEPL
ncbi:MAG TPA: hypothetical protein VGG30_06380 [Pirellulales bacterium]